MLAHRVQASECDFAQMWMAAHVSRSQVILTGANFRVRPFGQGGVLLHEFGHFLSLLLSPWTLSFGGELRRWFG